MAVTIEGYSVVCKTDRIAPLLESGELTLPNVTPIGDDDIWRCCFMGLVDAQKFAETLQALGLNTTQGPDSDVVLVSEFERTVEPYCEWLQIAPYENAVIGWKTGTTPESVRAREGWDPKVGSGLMFKSRDSEDLEFRRLEGNVEVYFDKTLGKEVYLGRTTSPIDALFQSATEVVRQHFRSIGEPILTGQPADDVRGAVENLDKVLAEVPDAWRALWYHGKANIALGNMEAAHGSLKKAFEIESNVEIIPRELAGVCLVLKRFDEAVTVGEAAVALEPDSPELLCNLATAYLLAARLDAAAKAVDAALSFDSEDPIASMIKQRIDEVQAGTRKQPQAIDDLH